MKCFCIGPSKFEECACPTCMLLRENLRLLDKQRAAWHRKSDTARKASRDHTAAAAREQQQLAGGSALASTSPALASASSASAAPVAATSAICACGSCEKDSSYRRATRSPSALREFVHAPCGKEAFPALRIASGKYSSEAAPEFYRRQCCRAPLPTEACPHGSKGACDDCGPCRNCGWELTMGANRCPIDYGDVAEAAMAKANNEAATAKAAAEAAAKAADAAIEAVPKPTARVAKAKREAAEAAAEAATKAAADAKVVSDGAAAAAAICTLAARDAEWKEFRPRIEADGKSYRDELVTVKGTRLELMTYLHRLFADWSPHEWIDRWSTHNRHLTYATFGSSEMCISTDFSAQYEHKAAWTRTCEHAPRSNMAVFVVTHSPVYDAETGERSVTTDIWRIFSEAKGSSQFHNKALAQIVDYYREKLGLTDVFVFSDGCRSQYSTLESNPCLFACHLPHQLYSASHPAPTIASLTPPQSARLLRYKGKRNFAKVAQFPSEHNGVNLHHRFAASHHFKGPHDAYGKDCKHLSTVAERHQKVRLASCFDWYHFCASTLPTPKKFTSKQIVDRLPTVQAVVDTLPPPTEAEREAARVAAREEMEAAVTEEAMTAATERLIAAGGTPPPMEEEEPPEHVEMADAEMTVIASDVEMAAVEEEVATIDDVTECECGWASEDVESEAEMCDFADEDDDGDFEEGAEEEGTDSATATTTTATTTTADATTTAAAAALAVDTAAAATATTAVSAPTESAPPPAKRRRLKVREREILEQLPGQEASGSGLIRTWRQEAQRPGIFSASNYFYLYYALLPTRPEVVPVGQLAKVGQCHGYLEEEANDDASSIKDSNSTYEFVGASTSDATLLYLRTYTCACSTCRLPSAVSTELSDCPNMGTVGKWRQASACAAAGVVKQAAAKRGDAIAFAKVAKVDELYASFGAHSERGARPYWLLKLKKAAYQLKKKAAVEGGTTLRKDSWVVEAQWYLSTSDEQNRKSYKLLEPVVQIPVGALIQEHGLEWTRAAAHEPILKPASHDLLMLHNYSNIS